MRPSVVVVGSGSPQREYTPPLQDQERLQQACRELGRELARARCDLVVFSSADDYLEKDVVRGYVGALEGGSAGRVVVRTPALRRVDFGLPPDQMVRVEVESDTASEWEVSYYRSIYLADGLITVGGGRSTRIAALLAIANRTPLVTLASFGGAAAVVRDYLEKNRNDASADDIVLMGRPWSTGSARELVQCLLAQLQRRARAVAAEVMATRAARRARTFTALTAVVALLTAASTVLLADGQLPHAALLGLLLGGPMLGAVGGAMLRESTDEQPHAIWSAARGLGAGMLAAMLYVASQLLTSPDLLSQGATRRLLWFVIPVGIAAGYTFDLVYARLRQSDVVPLRPPATDTEATSPSPP
jgi:hypothetical protein